MSIFHGMNAVYAKLLVSTTLRAIPIGSLLLIDYVPTHGVRPEVRDASAVLGVDPTNYIVELTGVGQNTKGEPYFRGKALNRGGACRTFSPFRGQLRRIEVLRVGPQAV